MEKVVLNSANKLHVSLFIYLFGSVVWCGVVWCVQAVCIRGKWLTASIFFGFLGNSKPASKVD